MIVRAWVTILTVSLTLGHVPANAQSTPRDVMANALKANALRDRGELAKAEQLYLQVLPGFAQFWKPTSTEYAATLNHLGRLYEEMGRFQEAEAKHEESLKIREALSKTHPDLVESLNHLGTIYLKTIRLEKSVEFFDRSYQMSLARHGEIHEDVAKVLNNLAIAFKELRQFHKAEPLLRRCLAIYRKLPGDQEAEIANALNNLAAILQDMGQYDEAEKYYRESLALWIRLFGKNFPQVAQVHHNLGSLYTAMGDHKKAEEEIRSAVAIREALFGAEHFRVGNSLNGLASVYANTNRIKEAADTFDRTQRIAHRHIVRVLPNLSEAAQLDFLRFTERNNIWAGLSLTLAHPQTPGLVDRSAEWLLNSKGRSQLCRAQTMLALRDAGEGRLGKELEELMEVRRELVRTGLGGAPISRQQALQDRLKSLSEKEQDLTRILLQKGATVAVPDWVERAQLQKVLPADACFVDFVRLEVFDFARNQWQPARYAAWVTPAAGPTQLVPLGDAKTIDAAVLKTVREIQGGAAALKAVGEIEAEKLIRKQLDELAQLLLTPLRPHLNRPAKWIISPDGPLWLTPWAALPLDNNTYAVEKYTIQLVVSGRDLVRAAPVPQIRTRPAIFANPDFNKQLAEVPAGLRGLSADLALGNVKALPGTATEANEITDPVGKLYGNMPKVYTEADASVPNFRALSRPRALVLATHGFYLPDVRGVSIEDPLLRCGLLLAGCNKPGDAGRAGVLTGREILSADLRGCELTILSACETGLGDARQGEGIAGLRQAFQLAGSQGVLASLWKVPDEETSLQMIDFVNTLAAGRDRVEALALAQRKRIEDRRNRFGGAHPFNWAAFTFTGAAAGR